MSREPRLPFLVIPNLNTQERYSAGCREVGYSVIFTFIYYKAWQQGSCVRISDKRDIVMPFLFLKCSMKCAKAMADLHAIGYHRNAARIAIMPKYGITCDSNDNHDAE